MSGSVPVEKTAEKKTAIILGVNEGKQIHNILQRCETELRFIGEGGQFNKAQVKNLADNVHPALRILREELEGT